MATPTLQDVLGAVPAVGAAIDEMTEIIPGVPSNEHTLKELLKGLDEVPRVETKKSETQVWWEMFTFHQYEADSDGVDQMGEKNIQLSMCEPTTDGKIVQIYDGEYDFTPKGLMNAITDGKRVMKRYREDGLCPDCETPDRKRLRGAGLPYCAPCIIKKSLSM